MATATVVETTSGAGWCARYRIGDTGDDAPWSACRLRDITLDGARVELDGDTAHDALAVLDSLDVLDDAPPFLLQIDSIADDEVGVTMRAAVRGVERDDAGCAVADIEFAARREERLLLHLLVRLHALV